MTGRFSLYAEYFRSDPADFAIYLIMFVSALLISLILHEVAHGYVALQCGDPTARNFGRLSLRPSHSRFRSSPRYHRTKRLRHAAAKFLHRKAEPRSQTTRLGWRRQQAPGDGSSSWRRRRRAILF